MFNIMLCNLFLIGFTIKTFHYEIDKFKTKVINKGYHFKKKKLRNRILFYMLLFFITSYLLLPLISNVLINLGCFLLINKLGMIVENKIQNIDEFIDAMADDNVIISKEAKIDVKEVKDEITVDELNLFIDNNIEENIEEFEKPKQLLLRRKEKHD